MLILITSALQMRMDKGRELFSEKKVRRGFLTHRTTINHTTRGKPLRLQKTLFFDFAHAHLQNS